MNRFQCRQSEWRCPSPVVGGFTIAGRTLSDARVVHVLKGVHVIRLLSCLFLVLVITGCTDTAPRGGGDILVLGDSVMAWNGSGGRAIPDVIATSLRRTVVSKAVPGAQFQNGSMIASAVGFNIQKQFPGGQWNWIVMNGGANDLSADCGCGRCGAVVNGLIASDGQSGAIPTFLRSVRARSGARVLWMGYYAGSGKGSFEGCRPSLVELDARVARFAKTTEGVYFADSEDVIDRNDPALFAADNTHPSPQGSGLIGSYLAKTINQVDPPRSQITK